MSSAPWRRSPLSQRLRPGRRLYDFDTGKFAVATEPVGSVSHLSAVVGLNELCAELIGLVHRPEFKDAYLD